MIASLTPQKGHSTISIQKCGGLVALTIRPKFAKYHLSQTERLDNFIFFKKKVVKRQVRNTRSVCIQGRKDAIYGSNFNFSRNRNYIYSLFLYQGPTNEIHKPKHASYMNETTTTQSPTNHLINLNKLTITSSLFFCLSGRPFRYPSHLQCI